MKRRTKCSIIGLLALGVLGVPALVGPVPAQAAQPTGLDHFLCYDVSVAGPIAEQVPFGLTPAVAELVDQFGRVRVAPRLPDRLCNPVNKILPNGQGFPPTNPNAHLACDPFDTLTNPPPPKLPVSVRVENQFGKGLLRVTERERLCLPTWKQDPTNPNAPGSVPVPRPAGTPVQPPGLDHFLCYEASQVGAGFGAAPPFVTLVDQFGTRQVTLGGVEKVCNPVTKILATGQQFPPANPKAHLVCYRLQSSHERAVRLQNQFGTGQVVAGVAARLCLPSFKRRIHPVTDFDGDGDTDVSVFRPSTGQWFVLGQPTVSFGLASDIPVPCDYDGDGDADIAVFRPSAGGWLRLGAPTTFFGLSSDIPVPADYDGDGDCDIAVYRPSVGGWYVMGAAPVFFGLSADIPMPFDFDGDGDADIAVFRPSVGGWYVSGGATTFLGLSGDIPVAANYDGDGDADIAVFRPPVGGWYPSGAPATFFGVSGDFPVPGDYDGDTDADIAVFRRTVGGWYVSGGGTTFLGSPGDIPLVLPNHIQRFFTFA